MFSFFKNIFLTAGRSIRHSGGCDGERVKGTPKKCSHRKNGSTLYVGLAHAVPPTNTNFRLTFLLTRFQEALYEDLPV